MIVHASCVAIRGAGLLILGASGRGKSDLAFRLIDRGAVLVADDRVTLKVEGELLIASAPRRIAGLLEVRGVGIVAFPHLAEAPIALALDLDLAPERLPPSPADWPRRRFGDRDLAVLGLDSTPPSAALRAEAALALVLRHAG
jgi:serine kinase of HPr protein (carbohydrate metabolism regulator)